MVAKVTRTVGNFGDVLEGVLEAAASIDLLFGDGNHRRDPTLCYFSQAHPRLSDGAVVVFDDNHWSDEMTTAWREIRAGYRVKWTADFGGLGVVAVRS